MAISLDDLSARVAADREDEKRHQAQLVDPFKRERTEPGRARPHGRGRAHGSSMAGRHRIIHGEVIA